MSTATLASRPSSDVGQVLTFREVFSELGNCNLSASVLSNINAICQPVQPSRFRDILFKSPTSDLFHLLQQIGPYNRILQPQLLEIEVQFRLSIRSLALLAWRWTQWWRGGIMGVRMVSQ
jgi:hypothetical protein